MQFTISAYRQKDCVLEKITRLIIAEHNVNNFLADAEHVDYFEK